MRARKQDVNSVKTSTREKANAKLDKRYSALRFLIYYSFVIKIESPLIQFFSSWLKQNVEVGGSCTPDRYP